MPIQRCQANGKSGLKWGDSGKCFTGTDARQRALAQGRAIEAVKISKKKALRFTADIFKVDLEKRLVTGWFSVIKEDGEVVIDNQGDVILEETLEKAAHQFMQESRMGGHMHETEAGGIVESIVFTEDKQKQLGIELGKVGWFGTYKVFDDSVWERVKSGDLPMFSIGGRAVSENYAEPT